jgi:hypothetical protein
MISLERMEMVGGGVQLLTKEKLILLEQKGEKNERHIRSAQDYAFNDK